MNKQNWYCIHSQVDQTQIGEVDSGLADFFNKNHVKNHSGILSQASQGFLGHKAERAFLFFNYKYNKFSNLPNTQDYRLAVYGVRGIHDFSGRQAKYANYYFSNNEDMVGSDFFINIFGSAYLTEAEARVDEVKEAMDKKKADCDIAKQSMDFKIKEKDRNLVCRIAERLWTSQVETNGSSRLIICLNENQDVLERSIELLQQVYLLIPQRLRLNMGFATNCKGEDVKTLTEDCDLPIHVFTMGTNDIMAEANLLASLDMKYPIVLFDGEHPENNDCDAQKLELLLSLSRKISIVTDAKLAYAEKNAIKENSNMVSFKNMESVLQQINGSSFCWWEREDLESIEDVYKIYADQSDLMNIDVLRSDAINTFYQKLLPWKDYAQQISQVVINDQYPNKQELLSFFANELQFAKVISAMQGIRESVEESGRVHEQQALNTLQQQCTAELAAKDSTIEQLNAQKTQITQEYEKKLSNQKIAFANEKEEAVKRATEPLEIQLKGWESRFVEEVQKQVASKDVEIKKMSQELHSLKSYGAGAEISRLQQEVGELQDNVKRAKRKSDILSDKVKKGKILTIIVSAVAVIFLGLSIFFLISNLKNGELQKKYDQQTVELEAAKAQVEELQNQLDASQEGVLILYHPDYDGEVEVAANKIKDDSTEVVPDIYPIDTTEEIEWDKYTTVYLGYETDDYGNIPQELLDYLGQNADSFTEKTVIPYNTGTTNYYASGTLGEILTGATIQDEQNMQESDETENIDPEDDSTDDVGDDNSNIDNNNSGDGTSVNGADESNAMDDNSDADNIDNEDNTSGDESFGGETSDNASLDDNTSDNTVTGNNDNSSDSINY